jgi:hypothetical protein
MWWVVDIAANGAPTSAEIRAGHVSGGGAPPMGSGGTSGSGGTTVTTSPFTATATSLTASTAYKVHFTQDDLASNHSSVASSSSFTTASSAWTPASVTTAFWYDATDNATVFSDAGSTQATAGSNTVREWHDKSGNSRHLLQATSALRPAYATAGINSKKTLTFGNTANTTTSGYMATSSFTTIAQPFFIIGVMKSIGASGFSAFMTDVTNGNGIYSQRDDSASTACGFGGSSLVSTGVDLRGGTAAYIYGDFASGSVTVRATGHAAVGPTSTGSGSLAGGFQISQTANTGVILGAEVGEVFCIPSPTGSYLTDALAYLNAKWGV